MKKLFALILTFVSFLGLVSCGAPKVTSLALNGESSYTYASKQEFEQNIGEISFTATYSDSTTKEVVLSLDMISAEDLAKLDVAQTYDLTISYDGATTTVEVTIVGERYSVTVVYPNGDPVTSGVSVQWCTGDLCLLPVYVNSKGVAYNACDDANYYIHIEGVPQGYSYDPNAYTSNASNKHITIELIENGTISGEGTEASPYVVNEGAHVVNFNALSLNGMKYFAFTATESKEYSIRSICQDKLAINEVNPYVGFMGTEINMAKIDTTGNDERVMNFNHTFTATANTTYYFVIMIEEASNASNADCTFVIE